MEIILEDLAEKCTHECVEGESKTVSWECGVDLRDDGLELLVLDGGEGDALLARLGVHGALVDVVLADVDEHLAAPLADLENVLHSLVKNVFVIYP